MISKNFIQQYKIEKTPIEEAYEYQLALKNNKEYENIVDRAFIEICNRFMKKYQGVKIEPPRGREKSQKSLMGKIKKLEIERLSKLYILNKITQEEKIQLYNLLQERIKSNEQTNNQQILDTLDKIFNEDIEESEIEQIQEIITTDGISDHSKITLLRMLVKQIKETDLSLQRKNELLQIMDERYGKAAAVREKNSEKDLIRYDEIEKLKKDRQQIQALNDPHSFLKAKDLRGIKLVISYVPDDIETENKKLKEFIQKRKSVKTNQQRSKYNDLCCIELEKEFINQLILDKEFLDELEIEPLKDSYKHKSKTNGYIADHVKFKSKINPDYLFELQLRSIYREELSGPNGPAAHDKRPGKSRELPNIINKNGFLKELKCRIPKYTLLKETENGFETYKCTTLENTIAYYQKAIEPGTQYYYDIIEILKEEDEKLIY